MPRLVIGGERAQERWEMDTQTLHTMLPVSKKRSAPCRSSCMLHRVRDLINEYDARLCLLLHSTIVNMFPKDLLALQGFWPGHTSYDTYVLSAECGLSVSYHLTRHDRAPTTLLSPFPQSKI